MNPALNQLLKWGIENSDPLADSHPPTVDGGGGVEAAGASGRRPDLEALNALFSGPSDADLMKEAMTAITSSETSLSNKLVAFDNFEQLIESLDNANNMTVLQLWEPLIAQLQSEEADVRHMAAWCVGTAVQNNVPAQKSAVDMGAVPALVKLALQDKEEKVRRKAIYALSSSVRNYQPAFNAMAKELPEDVMGPVAGPVDGSGSDAGNMDHVDELISRVKQRDSGTVETGLDANLAILLDALSQPAKVRKTQAQLPVRRICELASRDGLSEVALEGILDIIIQPRGLDQRYLDQLVAHLYPADGISATSICNVVACLGQGRRDPSPSTQAGLVHWLALVFSSLRELATLSRLYSTLFNLLNTISLRKPLCHLLALMTRRKHVKPFRVKVLLGLARIADDAALKGLLKVYRDYRPSIDFGTVLDGRAPDLLSSPDPEWQARLLAIRAGSGPANDESPLRGFKLTRRGGKRGTAGAVPDVLSFRAHEKSVTLEEIDDLEDLIDKFDRLELPSQAVSILGDPLLQKYLVLRPSESSSRRVHNWLVTFFEDELDSMRAGAKVSKQLLSLLEAILSYARYTKTLPAACETFLERYLLGWDGEECKADILELVSFAAVRSLEGSPTVMLLSTGELADRLTFAAELRAKFYDPIEAAMLDNTPSSRLALLEFYTTILRTWHVRLLARSPSTSTPGLSLDDRSPSSSTTHLSTAFSRLSRHMDTLSLSLLESASSDDCLVQISPALLDFYDLVATSALSAGTRVILPSPAVVYLLFFSPSLSILSRLCHILSKYKRAFEAASSSASSSASATAPTSASGAPPPYPRETIAAFNTLILDICNCLWRNRALEAPPPSRTATATANHDAAAPARAGCLLPASLLAPLRGYLLPLPLPSLFSVSYSPLLAPVALAALRALEHSLALPPAARHPPAPITQSSLEQLAAAGVRAARPAEPHQAQTSSLLQWMPFRVAVLRYLDDRAVGGVGDLLRATMKGLMTAGAGAG
ncbi:MAG: hypothetical protein M1826_002675 [Phylliscum demangeonii]|nr:MAG: hypothetical protein M1826_002675 [Phylliscum demangeonii]